MNLLFNSQPNAFNIVDSLRPLLVDLNKMIINRERLTAFDRTNFYASIKTGSVIVLRENDYINLKHAFPMNSNILIVSIDNDQMRIIENNVRMHNIHIPIGELPLKVDQFVLLFLQSHGHPVYERNDAYSIPIEDDTLWNTFDNVKITIKMIKNGDINHTTWKGTAFKGHNSEGMEWTY